MTNVSLSNDSSSIKNEFTSFSLAFVNFTIFYLTSIFLMFPVCVLILYLGYRQWHRQRSTTTAPKMAHSDIFIYHLVVMELVGVVGSTVCIVGIWVNWEILKVGSLFCNFSWFGEALFHILTCVERYLAVVHPITYLSLRSERGIRIRNICIGCVWVLSFTLTSLFPTMQTYYIISLFLIVFALLVIPFCSVSILCILIRPGPGDKLGSRGSSNQSKMKAVYIVMVIMGMVSLRFLSNIVWLICYFRSETNQTLYFLVWVSLPCSLSLPLLFLLRSGTFTFCMRNKN